MIAIGWLLACESPVQLAPQVVDAVQGDPRSEVVLRLETDAPRCGREVRSDALGRVHVELCAGARYRVIASAPDLRVWPPLTGLPGELPSAWSVLDAPGEVALVGGGIETLGDAVDVRSVALRGGERSLSIPAIVPVDLPSWSSRQAVFLPDGSSWVAQAVRPTGPLELDEGGPLQPWFALGVEQGPEGAWTELPDLVPTEVRTVPGGTLWRGLPSGRIALRDGKSGRALLVEVAPSE